jgi:hypothetical protein
MAAADVPVAHHLNRAPSAPLYPIKGSPQAPLHPAPLLLLSPLVQRRRHRSAARPPEPLPRSPLPALFPSIRAPSKLPHLLLLLPVPFPYNLVAGRPSLAPLRRTPPPVPLRAATGRPSAAARRSHATRAVRSARMAQIKRGGVPLRRSTVDR